MVIKQLLNFCFFLKIIDKYLLRLRNDLFVLNLQKHLLIHRNECATQVKLGFIKFKCQFRIIKINSQKDEVEQGKCYCHSNCCFKCLSPKQLLGRNQVLDRMLP